MTFAEFEKADEVAREIVLHFEQRMAEYAPNATSLLVRKLVRGVADAARREERKRCAEIADEWANGESCAFHDTDPCCHVRIGAEIAARIRALDKETA